MFAAHSEVQFVLPMLVASQICSKYPYASCLHTPCHAATSYMQFMKVRTKHAERENWSPCAGSSYCKHLAYAAAKEERIPDDLWVQCDFPQCLKWRKMPRGTDPTSLPDNWFCYNHPDPAMAALSHAAPEEEYKVPAEAEVGVACVTWCISAYCLTLTHYNALPVAYH